MSAVQVACDMKEIKILEQEIKRMSIDLKGLRIKKKELEERVLGFLQSTRHDAVKFDEIIAFSKDGSARVKKKKTDREREIIEILQNAGVMSPEQILNEIKGTYKGESKTVKKLTVKKESEFV
jgi:hypothetical protein